jgi:hypothetical protein
VDRISRVIMFAGVWVLAVLNLQLLLPVTELATVSDKGYRFNSFIIGHLNLNGLS